MVQAVDGTSLEDLYNGGLDKASVDHRKTN